ncbi:MAG TPA: 2,3-bisphosphoglycerate-independent phosphoglycerate mutase, partial [Phycisphaerae bacterium]|nr:2,3-bisphosphoglycerate-independent phosphoglycerate mutase [Phycisphaerae bacterium]
VGHLNMGAGRIVKQEIVRVDEMIADGSLFKTPRLMQAVARCKQQNKAFHLMGLVQDQGVHAMGEHFSAFIKFLGSQGVKKVFVHFFADGRDTPPRSALIYLKQLEDVMKQCNCGTVATVMGRFWAMDRAENWARTQKAFNLLTRGEADYTAPSAAAAIESAYKRADEQIAAGKSNPETDEFICPTAIVDSAGQPVGTIQPGDAVLHMNYRQDRAIQLTKAFVEDDFKGFDRGPKPDVFYMGLTRYYDEFPFELIPPMNMANLLGEVLAANRLRQLRIAEFQKYKHVTSFFNGKRLEPLSGEDRIQVESITIPEDKQPEMSAYPVTDLVLKAVNDGIAAVRRAAQTTAGVQLELGAELEGACPLNETYDVIVLNYANGDMVGHTGSFDAARKAIETVDECIGKVVPAVLARGGKVLVTSDHGNAEQMLDENGKVQTAHTVSPVHCVLVGNDVENVRLISHGKLADIAPTMLKLLGLKIPAEMTAQCLIK